MAIRNRRTAGMISSLATALLNVGVGIQFFGHFLNQSPGSPKRQIFGVLLLGQAAFLLICLAAFASFLFERKGNKNTIR
jgi:hypothetical protein